MSESLDNLEPEPEVDEAPARPSWTDERWQGHTHVWPEPLPEDPAAIVECAECHMPSSAGSLVVPRDE